MDIIFLLAIVSANLASKQELDTLTRHIRDKLNVRMGIRFKTCPLSGLNNSGECFERREGIKD